MCVCKSICAHRMLYLVRCMCFVQFKNVQLVHCPAYFRNLILSGYLHNLRQYLHHGISVLWYRYCCVHKLSVSAVLQTVAGNQGWGSTGSKNPSYGLQLSVLEIRVSQANHARVRTPQLPLTPPSMALALSLIALFFTAFATLYTFRSEVRCCKFY